MRARALLLPLLLSAAAPACVHAQGMMNMTPMTDRILSDPSFLPLKGQFYGESTYSYVQTNGENYDSLGRRPPIFATSRMTSTNISPTASPTISRSTSAFRAT